MADHPAAASTPAIQVNTLAISLPTGFERRAARIGRLTAESLASAAPPARDAAIAVLRVPPLRLRASWSDHRIAAALAAAIRGQLDGGGP